MKIAVFFAFGMSVNRGKEVGLFTREKPLYEKLGDEVYWFTYGKNESREDLPSNIKVIEKKYPIPDVLYSFLLPLLNRKVLKEMDLIKTTQMYGAWSAVIASKIYNKPLIVKTGYTWSIFKKKRKTKGLFLVELIEKLCYALADVAVVTTEQDRQYICKKYKIDPDKVFVIPNYIDPSLFRPRAVEKYKNRIITVSRLDAEKNLDMLIEALHDTGIGLDIVGTGNLKEMLEKKAKNLEVDVRFIGKIANKELPKLLNKYPLFVLASHYEGMPKALIEAMACRVPVLATDVENTNKIIKHKNTGYLVKKTPSEIRKGIITLLNDGELSKKMSERGYVYALERYSIDKIVKQEEKMYLDLKRSLSKK